MNLQKFVERSITQAVTGVKAAQDNVAGLGAVISPPQEGDKREKEVGTGQPIHLFGIRRGRNCRKER